ncbi:MAG: dolichyl-phosphate beta-glucosyltransferase [Patescibacteria group bacterium]|nr:dolichyl-phosphate beta-glucosyltransferase [Patescibacteria group bacterium]
MNLSIVIPVFNEAQRLPQSLTICQKAAKANPGWEFIFVSDGSTDTTNQLVKQAGFKLIAYVKNQGKGYALKQGVAQASQPLTLISDIDWSTPLSELDKFFPISADIVVGSRKTAGAQITKHQSPWREFLGRQFTNLTNLWLGTNVSDVTCGFKLFKTPVAKKLFALSKIKGWGYDAEILYLAKKLGFKVTEVPVIWQNDENTKVSLLKDILRSLIDLYLIRA